MSLTWRGNQVLSLIKQTGLRAIHDGAENVLTESINEAPIQTGTLRRSGKVNDIEDAVEISFNTPYAVKQHEDITMYHTEGKAKFLEDSLNRNIQNIERLVGDRIKQALNRR